jgi:hemerythrin-like domain-containing protein
MLEVAMNKNIYTALKQDHDEVKNMLKQLVENPMDAELFEKFKNELSIHNRAEEDAFYNPLAEKLSDLALITTSSETEHDLVDEMMAKYEELEEEEKNILIRTIKKSVESHISKEEEEVFNIAKERFSSAEEKEIFKTFQDVKEKMKEDIEGIATD